jgi:hypothetical protein
MPENAAKTALSCIACGRPVAGQGVWGTKMEVVDAQGKPARDPRGEPIYLFICIACLRGGVECVRKARSVEAQTQEILESARGQAQNPRAIH